MFPSDRLSANPTNIGVLRSIQHRQTKDWWPNFSSPVCTHHAVKQGPVAVSASFHRTRHFFRLSALFQWFKTIQSGSAPTWAYAVFISQLRKKISLNWSKCKAWFQPCHTSVKFPPCFLGVVVFHITGTSNLFFFYFFFWIRRGCLQGHLGSILHLKHTTQLESSQALSSNNNNKRGCSSYVWL